jgi:hypothetical protein
MAISFPDKNHTPELRDGSGERGELRALFSPQSRATTGNTCSTSANAGL